MARKSISENEKNSKVVRWDRITHLISEEEIGTQSALAKRLNEEGFGVTQATVSRDISELGLIKAKKKDGGFCYKTPGSVAEKKIKNKFISIFNSVVTDVDDALNQVVIKCEIGMASAVCASLDLLEIKTIIGTIAGDDTILVITKSEKDAKELKETLKSFMQ